jgi:predicted nucleic acid-binding protein
VEYNLRAKNPESVTAVNLLVDILAFEVVEVDADAIRLAAEYTELKDAPVVAAARASNSHYLLTFDKKHLLGQIQIMERSGGRIITPGDLLQLLRDAE